MLDGPDDNPIQMINTMDQRPPQKNFASLTQQGAALRNNPGLSEEQMRLMEENRRKAIERKRKSMQVQKEIEAMEANQQQPPANDTVPAKEV